MYQTAEHHSSEEQVEIPGSELDINNKSSSSSPTEYHFEPMPKEHRYIMSVLYPCIFVACWPIKVAAVCTAFDVLIDVTVLLCDGVLLYYHSHDVVSEFPNLVSISQGEDEERYVL